MEVIFILLYYTSIYYTSMYILFRILYLYMELTYYGTNMSSIYMIIQDYASIYVN